MHWLVLAAIALLLLDGEAKDNGTLEDIPRLPQDIYLPPNDPKDCTGEFYKPEYQLPLPQTYKSVYDPVKLMINGKEEISSFFVKDTIKVKDFKKVYAKQEEWLKDLMFRELILQKLIFKKLKENEMIEGINEENVEMKEIEGKIMEVKKDEIEKLMENIGMDKIEELIKERKKIEEAKKEEEKIEKEKKEGDKKEVKDEIKKIIKEIGEMVKMVTKEENKGEKTEEDRKDEKKSEVNKITEDKGVMDDERMEMREKVEEYDNLDIFHKVLVQKRNQEFLYSMTKDKRNFPFKIENFEMERRNERSCYRFDKVRGCKIDLSELYVKYKPTEVFGLNLARSYLPSSYWIKPDLEDVNLYKGLWHSDNKLDLLPDHEKGNDKHRVINRCSFYGKYPVHNGYPLNPVARTGFKGRGSFGQWGPTNGAGAILYVTDKEDFNKFEFLGVENGKYEKRSYIVTPGGFVDMGEEFEYSAKRELIEEAFGLKKKRNKEEFEKMEGIIGKGELVKFGGAELSQVSTDNAWTESITFAFGVDSTIKKELKLKKGSDAQQVMWIQIEPADKEIDVKTELEKLFDLEERIDYILENFEACWTPPKEEETSHKEHKAPKEEDRTGKDTQDNTQTMDEKEDKICYKLNSDKMQFMQNVAYLYLIKKYNEKTFLEILANKKVQYVEQGQIFNEKEKKEDLNEKEEDLKEKEESLNEEKAGEDDENK